LNLQLISIFGLSIGIVAQQFQISELQTSLKGAENVEKSTSLQQQVGETSILIKSILPAMIQIESGGNPNAYNKSSGAVGLMQVSPIVYKTICGLTKEETFIPENNIACATLFLTHLEKRFKGNAEKMLTFYNNGYKVINHGYSKKVLTEVAAK